jgi:acetylornithine deacetylase/succinyl-diaminopimelate desuccinylase
MKGGIAAAIVALDALQRSGRSLGANLVFHLVADEERGGGLGTKILLEKGLIEGDACLVPEPTDLDVCVAERGLLQGRIIVAGRPAHGSRPREGVSAIEHAARLVLAIHGADFPGAGHPLLGAPSANIGVISGGSAFNTVAETCVIGVDRRLLPGATEASATKELLVKIESAGVQGLDYSFSTDTFGEASEMSGDDPFAILVRSSVAATTGTDPNVIGMTFTTDARFIRNQAGIPTVVCGPGAIDQAHGDDEFVCLERLNQAAGAFAEIYANFH